MHCALADYEKGLASRDCPESWHFAPMVLNRLHSAGLVDLVPAVLLETLKGAAKMAAVNSLSRDIALQKIVLALEDNECEAIILKGAALDKYLYQREDFRLGVDIDLLFQSRDFERAEEILSGIAKPIESFEGRPSHARAAAQRSFTISGPTPVSVDIHQQFAQDRIFSVDYGKLLQRSMPHPAHSMQLRLLSPEDNLLHFAIHGFKDKCLFHKQTIDAWLLLEKEKIDWQLTVERARRWAVLCPLIYLLEGLRQVFQYELPEEVRQELLLKGARRMLTYSLLGERPPSDVRTGLNYRARQLGITWLLAGNLPGYLRYQSRYLVNRFRDYLS